MRKPIAPSIAQSVAQGIVIVITAWCLTVPAVADDTTPDTAGSRYMFSKQADGFLRLDTQTGKVSLCSQKAVGWACEAAPEDRDALENEITRLRAENAALKKDILAGGLPLPAGVMPELPNAELSLHLLSDADIDRMVTFMDRVWHRFVDAVERAQKQVLNKS